MHKGDWCADICYQDEDVYEKNLRILTGVLTILDVLSVAHERMISHPQSSSRENRIVNYVNANLFEKITTDKLAQHFF